jgi:sRNA-binding carbon storage regulator CsrA
MMVLTGRIGAEVVIGGDLQVRVIAINGQEARLETPAAAPAANMNHRLLFVKNDDSDEPPQSESEEPR